MNRDNTYAPLVGRILLAVIFLLSGWGKLMNPKGTEALIAGAHMPLVGLLLVGSIVVELGGALSLILGYHARIGAAALFLFLIPTTLVFHNFWAATGMAHQMQMMNFLKNMGIMGGMAMVYSFGPGLWSLDAIRERRARVATHGEAVTA